MVARFALMYCHQPAMSAFSAKAMAPLSSRSRFWRTLLVKGV